VTPPEREPTERQLFLAVRHAYLQVELLDGYHPTPEGVAKAAKLFGRIFNDTRPFVMVEVHDLPDLDPPINEEAADTCASLVRGDL
jgi:hypothetical protein